MKSTEFIEKNPELFSNAQNCKSLDEFLKLAKENSIEFEDLSLEEAYSLLNGKQELDDDLLDNVAGGSKRKKKEGSTVERVDNSLEAKSWEETGHGVFEYSGDFFVDKG